MNRKKQMPTRDDFHRFVSNHLSIEDFNTHYPTNGTQIGKVATAINWTYNNERWREND